MTQKKYNSIFQYKRNSMVVEKTYQKGCNLSFRMFEGEVVFNQFQVDSLELINDGIILYHLSNRQNDGSNYHFMNPEDEGFILINQKDFKDINILSKPNRTLDFEKILHPDLTTSI